MPRQLSQYAGGDARCLVVSGGLGAIKTARMRVGDTIIQETRDFHDVSMADYVIKKDRDSLNRYHAHYWGNAFHSDVAEATDATEATTTGQVQIERPPLFRVINHIHKGE